MNQLTSHKTVLAGGSRFRTSLIAALCAGFTIAAASAASIQITTGVDNTNTDNVLFNDGSLQHSGSFVDGNFAGSGAGYVVRFTSSSGNGQLEGSGGQATVEGLEGNDPLTSMTFGLLNGATFTAVVLNPDVVNSAGNGHINFSVSYILGDGLGPYTEQFTVDANGQNFFRIDAIPNARMTSVTFSSTDTSFENASQFRLGGFAPAQSVPDGGTTAMLLGASVSGIGFLARRKK